MLLKNLNLVCPTPDLKNSFLLGLREFQAEGLPWHMQLDATSIEADFPTFVASEIAASTLRSPNLVPETRFWAELDGQYVGRISVRHELNDALRTLGGHIGYDTVPSYRGRGIASAMLKLVLPHARELGLVEVLLTCDDTNVASIRVIEKNGGLLREKRLLSTANILKRYYWIYL